MFPAASILMQGMVILRAVRPADKPTAIGFVFGLVAVIAHIAGHLIYMLIARELRDYSGVFLLHRH